MRTATVLPAIAATAVMALGAPAFAADGGDHAGMDHGKMDHSQMDHSKMDHSGHKMDTARDAEGRRLWGQQHAMTPSMYDELRAKVPIYKDASKATIDMSMVNMGQEYQWYISPDTLRNDAGVLIMTHGFREQGDRDFKRRLGNMSNALPTSLALGMGMMMSDHVQLSIEDLEAAGASRIVVVPIVSTAHNELMRQWEYILGQRSKAEFVTVPQVRYKAELLLAEPPGDNPLVAEIILDNALELSANPAKEFVLIVAHGASGPERDIDNKAEMKVLGNLARYIREDGGFAGAEGFTLQDDAPPAIRDANVARLRAKVTELNGRGITPLVVTNLLGTRTIQPKIREDLKDLDYKFNTKGISQHPTFIKWIEETVRYRLEKPARKAARND
jgi:sirohydrochlorin cobaltochelatase